uniref:Uncharacterized protein n=1 Tax=Leersia perrieri TaxID=77586 RepID=A0A0D9WKR1_9ORYZ
MGHMNIGGEAGGVVMGCKVLPMWPRESGGNGNGMMDSARKKMVHGKKAVARVKDLLWPSATRWKKVLSFQTRDSGGGMSSKAGDDSTRSKLSFKWDAASCSSASSSAMYSPLSAVSAPAKAPSSQQQLRTWSSVPADAAVKDEQRMAQWITTDSDCECLTSLSIYFDTVCLVKRTNDDVCSCGAGAVIHSLPSLG